MFESGEPHTEPIDPENPGKSDFYRFGLDLLNFNFYWEGHVYLEALWQAHKRKGSIADFMKGLIKLGAAGVKIRLGHIRPTIGHLRRASEIISSVSNDVEDYFLGFELKSLIQDIDNHIALMENNNSCLLDFQLYPSLD